jgi:hypothetical protein
MGICGGLWAANLAEIGQEFLGGGVNYVEDIF